MLLAQIAHIAGYMGSIDVLRQLPSLVQTQKQSNSNAMFVCDPVMGDNGALYVSAELAALYRDEIVQLADVVLPNQTELEYLTGCIVTDEQSMLRAIDRLHDIGPRTVIVKSCTIDATLRLYASRRTAHSVQRYRAVIPRVDGYFSGTGDLFAALYIAWSVRLNDDLHAMLENTLATLHSIIVRTADAHSKELHLVQSVNDIINPQRSVRVELLEAK
jgi:pyridoxine kinase